MLFRSDDIELSFGSRASFVALVAECGFTLQARTLYEKYAKGTDGKAFVCDAALLVRLISLCAARLRILGNRILPAEVKRDESADTTSTVDHDLPPSSPGAPGSDPVDDQMPQAPLVYPESEHPTPVEGTVADHQGMTVEEQRDDIRAFADRVVDNFVRRAGPLRTLAHFQLTSLARAQMMLGRVADSFATLRVLLDRRELPDMHDINIALASLASISPSQAMVALFSLPGIGMRPDSVSFGTVIHYACVDNDAELVKRLIRRAKRWEVPLDYKTYSTIIRQTALSKDPTFQHVANVSEALDSILALGVIPSPNIARDSVFLALSARDPSSAYTFWKDFIRGKVGWNDDKHMRLRKDMAHVLLRECKLGMVDIGFCQRAILDLRTRRQLLLGLRKLRRFPRGKHAAHRRRGPFIIHKLGDDVRRE